jgi:hypothetical protein
MTANRLSLEQCDKSRKYLSADRSIVLYPSKFENNDTLRDRVPATLVDAYHSINNPQRIQKVIYSFQSNAATSNKYS